MESVALYLDDQGQRLVAEVDATIPVLATRVHLAAHGVSGLLQDRDRPSLEVGRGRYVVQAAGFEVATKPRRAVAATLAQLGQKGSERSSREQPHRPQVLDQVGRPCLSADGEDLEGQEFGPHDRDAVEFRRPGVGQCPHLMNPRERRPSAAVYRRDDMEGAKAAGESPLVSAGQMGQLRSRAGVEHRCHRRLRIGAPRTSKSDDLVGQGLPSGVSLEEMAGGLRAGSEFRVLPPSCERVLPFGQCQEIRLDVHGMTFAGACTRPAEPVGARRVGPRSGGRRAW